MDYIVLDLEWNQSSKNEDSHQSLLFEIIEIGAVRLDQGKKMIGEYSSLIRPQVYREMHQYTSNLIHLQIQELEQGRLFPEVVKEFISWCGTDYQFCTWGSQDLYELQDNLSFYELSPLCDGPLRYLDVQKLFSLAFEDGKSRKSLEYAVDFLQIPKDIPFHRAFSDAYYTGKVLEKIPDRFFRNFSIDTYYPPRSVKEEVKVVFNNYSKYISRVFPSRIEAMHDREVLSSKCYLCRKNLKKKIRWFSPNGKHFLCLAYCDKHGYLKGKIRFHKAVGEEVYVIKTTKLIGEEEVQLIKEKQEQAKENRKKRRQRK